MLPRYPYSGSKRGGGAWTIFLRVLAPFRDELLAKLQQNEII